MKKIGILTYHPYDNYGAVLQAFALQTYISKHLNEDVEIIDFCSDDQLLDNDILQLKRKKTVRSLLSTLVFRFPILIQLKKRKQRFTRFRQEYLKLSERIGDYQSLINKLPVKDVYLTGSDQVFNPYSKYTDVYYLGFNKKEARKVAYAPSFGVSDMEKSVVTKLQEYLKDFDAMSCREQSGADYLSSLLGKDVPCVVDPVFLLKKEEWNELLISVKKTVNRSNKYIFVYNLNGGAQLMKLAKQISLQLNLPISCVSSEKRHSSGARMFFDCGPLELLSLIQNAAYVVTDSFHGTALSLVFGVKVIPYIATPKSSGRITTIMNRLHLANNIVTDADTFDMSLLTFCDYSNEMQEYIYESELYLKKSLS